jgi:two-component sensor histidine kinase
MSPPTLLASNNLIKALEELKVHDHLCLIYETQVEQFTAIVPYLHLGLERGEQCIYIADENSAAIVSEAMHTAGIDVDAARRSGALLLTDKQDTYLKQGYFDPDEMIRFLAEATRTAKAAGFTALRVATEMTWALGYAVGLERLIEYEARLNDFSPTYDILAMCQYNCCRFAPEIILDVIRTHPLVIFGQRVCHNFYYVPPAQFLSPHQADQEVNRLLANIYDRETAQRQADEMLRQRNRDLALINRANQVFISTLDLDQVLTVVLEEVRYMLGILACSAWLVDPATGELVCRQVTTPQSELIRGWRLAPGQGLAGWVTHHGQSLIVADVLTDDRHFKGVDQKTSLPLRSILTVPLWARQNVIGVIQVVDTQVGRFDNTDLILLESLAATAAIAIENARLYEQARQDAETKAALLNEVNHRVKNNLAAIIGLLYAEQRHAALANQPVYQSIMADLVNRVHGLATVHSMLSASHWAPVSLSELIRQVIRSSLQALPPQKQIAVKVTDSIVQITADQAHNLALIINELTTNTIRHALAGRNLAKIAVDIQPQDNHIRIEFRDDGPGYPEQVLRLEQHGVGFELIKPLVRKSLRGELDLHNDQGAVTTIQFNTNLAVKEKLNQWAYQI